jgi:hypothetical protein
MLGNRVHNLADEYLDDRRLLINRHRQRLTIAIAAALMMSSCAFGGWPTCSLPLRAALRSR